MTLVINAVQQGEKLFKDLTITHMQEILNVVEIGGVRPGVNSFRRFNIQGENKIRFRADIRGQVFEAVFHKSWMFWFEDFSDGLSTKVIPADNAAEIMIMVMSMGYRVIK